MDSDKAWEYFGRNEPYFGVLTDETFKTERMSEESRERFFASGEQYTQLLLNLIRATLDPAFSPQRTLDFGCGVGRLSLSLAKVSKSVVGVDVSEGMLEQARRNAKESGLTNVSFVKGDDALSNVTGTFDFLNSLIVFQHIPTSRGEVIVSRMLDLLREGGVGALQFTYSYESATPRWRMLLDQAYKQVPYAWNARNVLKGRPFDEPLMQMNRYDLNRLFRILQEGGCHKIHTRLTETQSFGHPFYGVILLFRKQRLDVSEHA